MIVDELFMPASNQAEIKKQIDLKKQEIADLETELRAAMPVMGKAQRQAFAGTNPATGKPWTVDELQARMRPAPEPEASAEQSPEEIRKDKLAIAAQAAQDQMAGKPASGATTATNSNVAAAYNASIKRNPYQATVSPTTTATLPPGGGTGVKAAVPAPDSLSGWKANATGGAGVKAAADSEELKLTPDEYMKRINDMPESRIATALKKPVAEMLQMVETKQDVQRIKQFIDQTFTKYGAVTESAFAIRNQILEHVTQVGAQRRREHARKS